MEVPKNCTECKFRYLCTAYYGGSTCMYRNEVHKETAK